ncbi:MAG: PaaX family transcriptional regulator C-terminal domain-containing protein [Desulfitobacteriaceae bacterium]
MIQIKQPVRTQSMMFTILGDYIYLRNIWEPIWLGSLIKILNELGYSEQAVRLALTRMCVSGWLRKEKAGNRSFYSMTDKSLRLMEESKKRIFHKFKPKEKWDGKWCILIYSIPQKKSKLSAELRKGLSWFGFGSMSYGVWLSPNKFCLDVLHLTEELGVKQFTEIFIADGRDLAQDRELVMNCWDIKKINHLYCQFIKEYRTTDQQLSEKYANNIPDNICFQEKIALSHEFRKFPYSDPDLPRELLPQDWQGDEAAKVFDELAELLTPGAFRFFDKHLELKPKV